MKLNRNELKAVSAAKKLLDNEHVYAFNFVKIP